MTDYKMISFYFFFGFKFTIIKINDKKATKNFSELGQIFTQKKYFQDDIFCSKLFPPLSVSFQRK